MDFDIFVEMTPSDATSFLHNFLEAGAESASSLGIGDGITIDELPELLKRISKQITVVPRPPDPEVPAFIRDTEEYKAGLFDFTPESKRFIVGAAFAFGHAFVSTFSFLGWRTGDAKYASGQMPVVAGFPDGQELPALLVVRNLFSRHVRDPNSDGGFDKAVATWRQQALDCKLL
ncbi:MAG: hypothetical protein WCJ31_06520 [Planctomycetia bacterium]